VWTRTTAALRGRDVALWAAGLTFFAAMALVPLLVLWLWGASLLFGEAFVVEGTRHLAAALPDAQRAGAAVSALTDAALDAGWPMLLAALIPATFYGEGLRRALDQPAHRPSGALTGWKGRIGFLPVVVAGPLLLAAPLAAAPWVGPLYEAGGWSAVWGVVISFHIDWVCVSIGVSLVFAYTAASAMSTRGSVAAGFAAGAVLTGFLHGFVLFLAIPLDWSVPFAGLVPVGVAVALGLWLYLLHIVLLFAYRLALSTAQRAVQRPAARRA
jgi:membrane protein